MRHDDPASDGIVDYACTRCGVIDEVLIDATTILRTALADGRSVLLGRAPAGPRLSLAGARHLDLGIARRRDYLAMIEEETAA